MSVWGVAEWAQLLVWVGCMIACPYIRAEISLREGVLGAIIANTIGYLIAGLAYAVPALLRGAPASLGGFVVSLFLVGTSFGPFGASVCGVWSWFLDPSRRWHMRGLVAGIRGGLAVAPLAVVLYFVSQTWTFEPM